MTEPLDYLDRLARKAREERAPQGDVRRRVLEGLQPSEPVLIKPMLIFTAGYAAAASVAVVFGMVLLNAMTDPVTSVFQTAVQVLP